MSPIVCGLAINPGIMFCCGCMYLACSDGALIFCFFFFLLVLLDFQSMNLEYICSVSRSPNHCSVRIQLAMHLK